MGKKGKNILPTRLLEKKFLMTRNHPPPPSRVKWSAPNVAEIRIVRGACVDRTAMQKH